MLEGILTGFSTAFSVTNIFMVCAGVLAGTLIGMLSGLGPISAIALMIPITYSFDSSSGLILMAGVYYGAVFGGSTSSILVNAPGVAGTVATTFDGTNYKLFLNGEEVWSTARNKNLIPANTSIKTIGVNFMGEMDDLRLWDVARTESEIKADMNKRLTGSESNLVAYYPMDVNSDYKLIDLTSNQNHGVIKNVEVIQKFSSNDCNAADGTVLINGIVSAGTCSC